MTEIAINAPKNTTRAMLVVRAEKARITIMLIRARIEITASIRVDLFTIVVFKE